MEMVWEDFIRKEELEISPGVIDEDLVRALTLNTYMVHIKELINDGGSKYPDIVSEHLEDVMADIFMCQTYVFEGRYPEVEEISDCLKLRENVEARKNLTHLCVNSDMDNWPETEKKIREMAPTAELRKINWESQERKQNAEKLRKKLGENGLIEL